MQGKIAIVTGAAQGIGAEVSRALVAAGVHVVLMDINADAGQAMADSLHAQFVHLDVTSADAWEHALTACIAKVGVPDYAHLNAGVMSVGADESFLAIDQLPLASYRRIVGVNLDGVVFGLQVLIPRMRERGGAITVTASIAGLIPLPIDPMYSATKHALIGLVRSIAASSPQSLLRINAICPGGVETAIVPAALRGSAVTFMPTTVLAREVVDLLLNGATGEIRVKLSEALPAFVLPPPSLG